MTERQHGWYCGVSHMQIEESGMRRSMVGQTGKSSLKHKREAPIAVRCLRKRPMFTTSVSRFCTYVFSELKSLTANRTTHLRINPEIPICLEQVCTA